MLTGAAQGERQAGYQPLRIVELLFCFLDLSLFRICDVASVTGDDPEALLITSPMQL